MINFTHFRVFAWTISDNNNVLNIETYSFDTLEEANKRLKKLAKNYDNYLITRDTEQEYKTWQYLTNLVNKPSACTNLCTHKEV